MIFTAMFFFRSSSFFLSAIFFSRILFSILASSSLLRKFIIANLVHFPKLPCKRPKRGQTVIIIVHFVKLRKNTH